MKLQKINISIIWKKIVHVKKTIPHSSYILLSVLSTPIMHSGQIHQKMYSNKKSTQKMQVKSSLLEQSPYHTSSGFPGVVREGHWSAPSSGDAAAVFCCVLTIFYLFLLNGSFASSYPQHG
ncbi:hypothetical protein AMECASPLE_010158 [Ameca splendens]|uniref:Uncharacterized protein n=1 Tax=Ameca splendens TaxID=208324 RepID=A0ABV1A6S0_9TELE